MNFLAKRRMKKTVHLVRHLVRHALNMREDVAPAADVAAALAAVADGSSLSVVPSSGTTP